MTDVIEGSDVLGVRLNVDVVSADVDVDEVRLAGGGRASTATVVSSTGVTVTVTVASPGEACVTTMSGVGRQRVLLWLRFGTSVTVAPTSVTGVEG